MRIRMHADGRAFEEAEAAAVIGNMRNTTAFSAAMDTDACLQSVVEEPRTWFGTGLSVTDTRSSTCGIVRGRAAADWIG